jgi:hypothetical protein
MVLVLLAASGANASTLWNNGAINNTTYTVTGTNGAGNPCDSVCASAGAGNTFTIFDNFSVGAGTVMQGFDFTDFLVSATGGNLSAPGTKTVNWSIWSGEPSIGTSHIVAGGSGTSIASLTGTCSGSICLEMFTVTGLNVSLAAGTYYIGTNVVVDNGQGYSTYRATSNMGQGGGAFMGWESAALNNGNTTYQTYPGGTLLNSSCGTGANPPCTGVQSQESVFDIQGTTGVAGTPEPATLTLFGVALIGLFFVRRRVA